MSTLALGAHVSLAVVNTVNPIGDAGLLVNVFSPASALPVAVVLSVVALFLVVWIVAIRVDANPARERTLVHRWTDALVSCPIRDCNNT